MDRKDDNESFGRCLLFLLLLSVLVCFVFLDRGALYYDEAIYAQVAKETVQGNHWLTLQWNGKPWFHKPPLYFWFTAVLFKVFGPSEFWARFLSALAGVGCVALVYLIANRIYSQTTAVLAALILLTSSLFVVNARRGMTDVLMTAFILLAVYGYSLIARSSRHWITVGIGCGLAVLTKGAAGLLAPAIIGIALIVDRRWHDIKKRELWIGIAVFVLLALPWHVALIALHGSEFVNAYLFRHVIARSASDLHQYNYGYGFYFAALWKFFWPWVVVAPIGIFVAIKQRRASVLLISVVLPLLLFSLARTKFNWYIVPIVPALAVLTAVGIVWLVARLRPTTQRAAWALVGVFVLVGALATFRYSRPNKEIEAVAALMSIADKDKGAISTSPESLEMTVLYYTGRKLCADPVVSPLSFQPETQCETEQIRHFIFRGDKRRLIESRYGRLRVIAESNGIAYGAVDGFVSEGALRKIE